MNLHKFGISSSIIILGSFTSCNFTKEPVPVRMDERPNILLFVTDDNASTYWGFGGGPDLSPTIDQIAREGIEATQFYCTAAVCTPSRYSLHTGKFAGRCSDSTFLKSHPENQPYNITWNTYLDSEREFSMGEIMKKAGYNTGFVGKWHLGFDASPFALPENANPYDPEVDVVLKTKHKALSQHIKETGGFDYVASAIAGNNDDIGVKALQYHNLEWLAKGARDFIEKNKDSDHPFFLIVNITTHHGPCHIESIDNDINITQEGIVEGLENIMEPRSTIYERIMEKGYPVDFKTAGTVWTDDCVASVLEKITEYEMDKQTAVIFTTDHNRYDGKATCYQGGVHIPFLMKWPGVIKAGTKTNKRMQMTDLLPTFAEMAKVELPDSLQLDGKTMLSFFTNPKKIKNDKDDLFFEFGYTRAVLSGQWKYIALRFPDQLLENMKNGKVNQSYAIRGQQVSEPSILRYPYYFDADQLYNIKDDPDEQINLAYNPEYEGKLKQMKAILTNFTSDFNHPFELENPDPFYISNEYRNLNAKARNIDMEQFYWYRKGCY